MHFLKQKFSSSNIHIRRTLKTTSIKSKQSCKFCLCNQSRGAAYKHSVCDCTRSWPLNSCFGLPLIPRRRRVEGAGISRRLSCWTRYWPWLLGRNFPGLSLRNLSLLSFRELKLIGAPRSRLNWISIGPYLRLDAETRDESEIARKRLGALVAF